MYETDTKWRREVKRKTKILLYLSRLILYLFLVEYLRELWDIWVKGKTGGSSLGSNFL